MNVSKVQSVIICDNLWINSFLSYAKVARKSIFLFHASS